MTDDRSLERAARSWIEAGPTQAPEEAVQQALSLIETTPQERDLRIPWRPTSMLQRLVFAALSAAVAIGAVAVGASLIRTPDSTVAPCPATRDEAEAIDTFESGLSAADRTWGIPRVVPERVGPGLIAAFTYSEATDERTLIAIDPLSGQSCVLIRHVSGPVQGPAFTQLDWSPTGDVLAVGLAGDEGPEGPGPGQLLIWTPDRLLRVWAGDGIPYLDWSPDGQLLAVWTGASDAVLIQADGSADRTFDVRPAGAGPHRNSGLVWSPDGSRWAVTTFAEDGGPPGPTEVSIVDLVDGRVTPIEPGIEWLGAIDWIDDQRVLMQEWEEGTGSYRYLDVPVAAPENFAVVPLPDDVLGGAYVGFSPDHNRAAFVSRAGRLSIVDLTSDTPTRPVVVDRGVGDAENVVLWSPDGSQVLFHSQESVDGAPVVFGMWIVNADGSGLREISRGNVVAVDDPWQPLAVQGR